MRLYQPPPAPLEMLLHGLSFSHDLGPWRNFLESSSELCERICLDRYIMILNRLLNHRLYDCSVLDLGCSSGFFSYAFAVTAASQVTGVEDERAMKFGYDERAFLRPLREVKEHYRLDHLEIVGQSIENFLEQQAWRRSWDVVLCLSVLHHFRTGYGDCPGDGQLGADDLTRLYERLGAVTRRVLYLEVDETRIGDERQFFSELCQSGGFDPPVALGYSCSAPGVPRTVWELSRKK
ncbi:MAG TPA: class I SAM-dependent methyltransferase [Blastocatellia bacterium]|nr:class I SAM-dependent methyltransferase [Blastocatellia bacterium]